MGLAPRFSCGWVERRPKGEPASAFVQQLRKHLENARVVSALAHDAGVSVRLRRGEEEHLLELVGEPANVVLVREGVIVGAAKPARLGSHGSIGGDWRSADEPEPAELAVRALVPRGPSLVAEVMGADLEASRRRVSKAVRRRLKKLGKRLEAIAQDLQRQEEVPKLRHQADLLLGNLYAIPAGAREAVITDWLTGSPRTLAIGAGRSARQEAEVLYGRARKFERGSLKAQEREALTRREIAELSSLAAELSHADESTVEQLERSAQRLGVATRRSISGGRKAAGPGARKPYRKFFGSGERPILVGRSASDNDKLTQSARPWDHWLHARAARGSHVVVPLGKRESCPPELLLDAAHLAAHHSALNGEPVVDVQHCPRRRVRKPKGMAVGAVRVDGERVIALRVEPDRLARLIQSEER